MNQQINKIMISKVDSSESLPTPQLEISSNNGTKSPKAVKNAVSIKHNKVTKSKLHKESPLPRPYNRYNLFFILERERLIHVRGGNAPRQSATDDENQESGTNLSVTNENEKVIDSNVIASVLDGDYSNLFYPLSLPPLPARYSSVDGLHISSDWYVPVSKEKKKLRSHTKTHGVANFVDLAKAIGANWKAVQEEAKRGDPNANEALEFFAAVEKKMKKRHNEITAHLKIDNEDLSTVKNTYDCGAVPVVQENDNESSHIENVCILNSEAKPLRVESDSFPFSRKESFDYCYEQEQPMCSPLNESLRCIQCGPMPNFSPVTMAAPITPTSSSDFDGFGYNRQKRAVVTPSDFPMPPYAPDSEGYFERTDSSPNTHANFSGRNIFSSSRVYQQCRAPDKVVMQDFGSDHGETYGEFSEINNFEKNFCRSQSSVAERFSSNCDYENYNQIKNSNKKRNYFRSVSNDYSESDNSGCYDNMNDDCDEELGFQEFVRQVRRKTSMTLALNGSNQVFQTNFRQKEDVMSEWLSQSGL